MTTSLSLSWVVIAIGILALVLTAIVAVSIDALFRRGSRLAPVAVLLTIYVAVVAVAWRMMTPRPDLAGLHEQISTSANATRVAQRGDALPSPRNAALPSRRDDDVTLAEELPLAMALAADALTNEEKKGATPAPASATSDTSTTTVAGTYADMSGSAPLAARLGAALRASDTDRPSQSPPPAWIDTPRTENGVPRRIDVGPFATRAECDQELKRELAVAVRTFYAAAFGGPMPQRAPADLSAAVKEQWYEDVDTSFGRWVTLHALLDFDHRIQGQLAEWHREGLAAARLQKAAVVFAGTLGIMGMALAMLRLDIARQGRARRRHILAAILVAVLIVNVVLAAVLTGPWLSG